MVKLGVGHQSWEYVPTKTGPDMEFQPAMAAKGIKHQPWEQKAKMVQFWNALPDRPSCEMPYRWFSISHSTWILEIW
jgi:hypothetical protein